MNFLLFCHNFQFEEAQPLYNINVSCSARILIHLVMLYSLCKKQPLLAHCVHVFYSSSCSHVLNKTAQYQFLQMINSAKLQASFIIVECSAQFIQKMLNLEINMFIGMPLLSFNYLKLNYYDKITIEHLSSFVCFENLNLIQTFFFFAA